MASRPPKIIEAVAGWLVPAACRQEVLGDLRERYQRPTQYLVDVVNTLPWVIYSRIRRTTDSALALVEAVSLYTIFVLTALWLDRAVLLEERGYLRLAIPPAMVFAATILTDAYGKPYNRRRDPMRGPTWGLVIALLTRWDLGAWGLPASVLAWAAGLSWLMLAPLRVMFQPMEERLKTINIPAYWQKVDLRPMPVQLLHFLLPSGIGLAVLLYLVNRYG